MAKANDTKAATATKRAQPAPTQGNPLDREEAIYEIKRARAIAILLSGDKNDVAGPAADAIVRDLSNALTVLELGGAA